MKITLDWSPPDSNNPLNTGQDHETIARRIDGWQAHDVMLSTNMDCGVLLIFGNHTEKKSVAEAKEILRALQAMTFGLAQMVFQPGG